MYCSKNIPKIITKNLANTSFFAKLKSVPTSSPLDIQSRLLPYTIYKRKHQNPRVLGSGTSYRKAIFVKINSSK